MPKVRTSFKALGAALAVLSVMHLLAMFAVMAAGGDPRFATPDAGLGTLLIRLGADALLLMALHAGLRAIGRGDRALYALAGGLAAVGSYGLSVATGVWPRIASEGAVVTTALVPLLFGLVAGTVYHAVAGYAWPAGAPGAATAPAFAGPLQVRTSYGTLALIALAPPLACALVLIFGSLAQMTALSKLPPGWTGARATFGPLGTWAMPVTILLSSLTAASLPLAALAGASHALARAFKRTDYRSYGFAGFACAAFLPLLFGRSGGVPIAIPLGLGGVMVALAYRRFAGLEPMPLPEPLRVRDAEALVGAADPLRHEHRLIFEGGARAAPPAPVAGG